MTDAEIVDAVRECIGEAHKASVTYRRVGPLHIMTDGYRRYWNERLALESLRDDMTLADLLVSEHTRVREATLLILSIAEDQASTDS